MNISIFLSREITPISDSYLNFISMKTKIRAATHKSPECAKNSKLFLQLIRYHPPFKALPHEFTDPSPWLEAVLEVFTCECIQHWLQFDLDLLNRVKTAPLELQFQFWKQREATRGNIWGLWKEGTVLLPSSLRQETSAQVTLVHCRVGSTNCCAT